MNHSGPSSRPCSIGFISNYYKASIKSHRTNLPSVPYKCISNKVYFAYRGKIVGVMT
jgi:hypothetical protein